MFEIIVETCKDEKQVDLYIIDTVYSVLETEGIILTDEEIKTLMQELEKNIKRNNSKLGVRTNIFNF